MRFPSYSSEWHSYTLGEILTFYSTNSFSREKLNYDTGSVKNIHYGDIHTKFPSIVSVSDNKDIPFINNEIDLSKYSEDQYLQNGDLIIADASEDYEDIGKAIEVKNIDDEKVLAGLHTILARDNNNITVNGFKAYLFSTNSLKTKIKIIANGISVLGISKNSLSKLTVNVPSKNEQNDVVDFISLIDNKIELLEQKHQYYLDFKKFLMQQIFTQKLRFDFDEIRLKSISKINKGKQLNKEHMLEIGKFYVLNGGQEPSGYTDSWNTSENTITISEGGNSCGFVNFNTEKFWSGGHCYYLNKLSENIDVYYLYSYLKFIEPQIMRLRVGSGLPNIQKGDIENIKIKILPKKEQIKISNLLLSTDNKISSIESQKDSFEIFKKGLLQQMFVVRINWRCNFKLAKSPSFNKHLLILKNKIIFIIIE